MRLKPLDLSKQNSKIFYDKIYVIARNFRSYFKKWIIKFELF